MTHSGPIRLLLEADAASTAPRAGAEGFADPSGQEHERATDQQVNEDWYEHRGGPPGMTSDFEKIEVAYAGTRETSR